MDSSESKSVESCLAQQHIHQQWINAYRTLENEKFFEDAFDHIIQILAAPRNARILDVGCGTCAHSIRLAKRGFLVQAIDFSESALQIAENNIQTNALGKRIRTQREDLRALTLPDQSEDYALCWGVLMHIPEVEKAISELVRVIKPGGMLVISEGNRHSLQSVIFRSLRRFRSRGNTYKKETPAGAECWTVQSGSMLLTRETNIKWLIEQFQKNGFSLRRRLPGQLTEAYVLASSPLLRKWIHSLNHFWFNHVRVPHLAFGNILIFRKEKQEGVTRTRWGKEAAPPPSFSAVV